VCVYLFSFIPCGTVSLGLHGFFFFRPKESILSNLSHKNILEGNENENADTCDAKFQYGWIEIHHKN
jgi:hypothetical protein